MSVASDGGKLSADPPVLQDANVFGHSCSALYDTGSSICLVSEDFFRLCGGKLTKEPSDISILGVTGTPIEIIGQTDLKVNLLGQTVEHRFFITSKNLSFGCDIILGIDFIIGHQLMYNPSNRSFNFLKPVSTTSGCFKNSHRLSPKRRKRVRFLLSTNDDDVSSEPSTKLFTTSDNLALTIDDDKSYPLFVKDTVEIPRYSEQFVRMKLSRSFEPNDFPYLIQGHFDQSINGIQVARAITFLNSSYTLVRVANVSDQSVILRKNLRIAQVHPTTPPTRLLSESQESGSLPNDADSQPDLTGSASPANSSGELCEAAWSRSSALDAGRTPSEQKTSETDSDKNTDRSRTARQLPDSQPIPDMTQSEPRSSELSLIDLAHVPEPFRSQLRELLVEHRGVFGTNLSDIKKTDVYEHHIELTDTTPAYQRPYRLPFAHREIVKKEIDRMLAANIIEPSVSPYNSPIILVKKSNGGYRLVSDLRLLNTKIKDDKYPHSFALDAIDQLADCQLFSTLDLLSSFHQVPLAETSRPYTAFSANNQLLQYKVVAQGLKTSSAALNRALQIALCGLQGIDAHLYVDDILIASRTYEEHLEKLDRVLTRLGETQFVLNPSKCHFMKSQIKYLGFILDKHGVRPDPSKIQAIQDYPTPKSVKDVRAFLGFANHYRRHVKFLSQLQAPLVHLTRKNVDFIWSQECEEAFTAIKQSLLTYPVLRYPDFNKDFYLTTDASDFAISGILEQKFGEDLHPIAFISRQLNKAERNYSTTEKECLAITWSFENLRCYLLGHFTHVMTDHLPLKGIFKSTNPGGRLTRWSLKLSAYDFDVTFLPGRLNKADVLSRIKIDSQTKTDFLGHVAATVVENDGWTREKIKTEQRKDPDLVPIIDRLTKPHADKSDMKLHEPISNFFLSSDGVLYHVTTKNTKTRPFLDQLVVPSPMKELIVQKYHDSIWSGHLKFEKTLSKIRLQFYWRHMYTDVKRYVESCRMCMERSAHKSINKAPLQRTMTPEYPMHICSFDIVGPLKTSHRGNSYYLSWIEHFSRWPEAIPLSATDTTSVAKAFVEGIISRHGISKFLLSDRGSNFTSKLMQEICKLLGTKRLFTSPIHPMANGRVERLHSTIGNILSHFVDQTQQNWDEVLPLALFAIRSSVHRSTGDTPSQIFMGRDLFLPLDVESQLPIDPYHSIDSYRDLLHRHLTALHRVVRANNESAVLAQEKFHPTQSSQITLKAGMLVYLHHPSFKPGLTRKLQKVNRGPYRILAMTSPVNAKIQHLSNQKDIQTVHVDRLRQFTEHDPFNTLLDSPNHSDEFSNRSVRDATPESSNTGAIPPVTLPAEPGTLGIPPVDDVIDEGVLARLEENWHAPVQAHQEVPQADHLRYNLRPRAYIRPPDRYGT